MKLSENWLREWVNPAITREALCEKLTMSGLEIESLAPVADNFSEVVVGQVLRVEKHPEADRLHLCEVDVGGAKPLSIVCGAANVKPTIKVPTALVGAVLPNNLQISATQVRGVPSHGMLCSAHELGLAEESNGLFVLPQDAPVGTNVWDYLKLADYLIDVSITPNRGDCLSVMGLAKDVAALTEAKITPPTLPEIKAVNQETLPVTVKNPELCAHYVGRVIRQVKADAITPIWLQERLRRSGVRCISPVVDVTNYVMLELGQPMHAFSLDKIAQNIQVRMATTGEKLTLLDGSEVNLDADTLVIADQEKPLAIAGVMGGLESGVTLLTQDIFLESAYFKPATVARAGRHYNLSSDSAYRFERGIDPTVQRLAIERATELLLEIVGGQPGPVIDVVASEHLPKPAVISLRKERVTKLIGCEIPDKTIEALLQRLGFTCEKNNAGWQVTVPGRRSDVTLEIDLIEEIARLHGYDAIPCHAPRATLHIQTEPKTSIAMFRRALCDLGYQEAVTYSFIDKKLQSLFDPDVSPKELLNPITQEMAVMRTNLWPGLVATLLYNQNRQQSRVRLFEIGLRFLPQGNDLKQERVLSGLINGAAFPEQWGVAERSVDFFDLKGDLQNLFDLTTTSSKMVFKPANYPALHPEQTAEIERDGEVVGVMGALHPAIIRALKLEGKVYLFELKMDKMDSNSISLFENISKFPEIRRDIAILLQQSVPAMAIQDTIREVAGELLKEVNIFDVYQGKGIDPGHKSVALALTLQHSSRTLIDEEVASLMDKVIAALKGKFNAELRG
jgi:phenylalanyl-tRNA synthetase beta chain